MHRSRSTRLILPLLLAAVGVLLAAGFCSGAEFSADIVQKASKKTYTGKIYVKGGKMRQEVRTSRFTDIVINRPDQKSVYYVIPEDKAYMKVTSRVRVGADDPAARARMKKMGKMKKLGTEKVNGYVCTKTQWTTKTAPKYVLTEWSCPKLGVLLRTEFKGPGGAGVLIEYKNIKEGGVSDSVFDLPRGYRRIATPTAPKG